MKQLIQCANCGKITTLTRSDKLTCSNSCSVKLIYARNHNFQTPYQTFIKNNFSATDELINENLEIINNRSNNKTIEELDEKIKKYSIKLKTI